MFYNHEILTSRRYGVATIWLAATLGAKTKKLNRKAILSVNVSKACDTIAESDVPLALRLQSSLLFGVSTVYREQCSYLLTDVQSAATSMRMMMRALRSTNELNLDASKAIRPEQLLLTEDPSFHPDVRLNALDIDLDNLGLTTDDSAESSGLSPRTPRSSSMDLGIEPRIIMPPSSSSPVPAPFDLGPGDTSRSTLSKVDTSILNQLAIDTGFEPNADWGFDEEGNLFDRDSPSLRYPLPQDLLNLSGNELDITAPPDQATQQDQPQLPSDRVMDVDQQDDDLDDLARSPPRLVDDQQVQSSILQQSEQDDPADDEGSEFMIAPMHRNRRARLVASDVPTQLRSHDLRLWQENYLQNMEQLRDAKQKKVKPSQCRKNAQLWLWGRGLGGIGSIVNSANTRRPHPLDMFQGEGLRRHILGKAYFSATGERGTKRPSEEDGDTRRVRSRDDVGRGDGEVVDDQGFVLLQSDHPEDRELEVGRHAETPLPRERSQDLSSSMPWNLSAGGSSQRARSGRVASRSSSIHLQDLSLGHRAGSRVAGTLPLGRANLPGLTGAGPSSSSIGGDNADYGFVADFGDDTMQLDPAQQTANEEFELYGRAALVDSQLAQQSQWVRDMLDTEGGNFLEFVRNAVESRAQALDEVEEMDEEDDGAVERRAITFAELLPPESNSHIVAAQGFLHCLTLASKGVMMVKQRLPFEDIHLRPIDILA